MELDLLQNILRSVASAMKYPVIVILLIFIAFAVFCIGWIIVEAAVERRHINYSLPHLLDELRKSDDIEKTITESGLLERQKKLLIELTRHKDFDDVMMESLADNCLEREQSRYDRVLKATNLVAKLAPMTGLLGTLIPLGPGIIALGNGDTYTLANSMLTAFDTTIAGLIAAAVCLVIHTIRSHWYEGYMSDFETLVTTVADLEEKNEHESCKEIASADKETKETCKETDEDAPEREQQESMSKENVPQEVTVNA